MSYIQNTLMSNEKVVFYTRPHWIVFLPAMIWLFIALLLFVFGGLLPFGKIVLLGLTAYVLLGLFALLITLYHVLASLVDYTTAEYAITDKRVLMKTGLLHRKSLAIFLSKIESIHVDQKLLGRLCNYGSIVITGTGGGKDPFHYIPSPVEFRSIIQEQIEK